MMVKTIFIPLALIILSSCQTRYTKDDYLRNYEVFILQTKQNWEDMSENDWVEYDKENRRYYNEDYKKFAGEMKPNEVIRVHRFNFVYNFYRGEVNLTNLLSGKYNDLFKDMAIETNEIIRELKLALNDFDSERTTVIIDRLLE